LRRDFLSRQKQWEQEQAHSAPEALSTPEDEEMETDEATNPAEGKRSSIILEEIC